MTRRIGQRAEQLLLRLEMLELDRKSSKQHKLASVLSGPQGWR